MCFSRYLALAESLVSFNLIKFENVTSYRVARTKITKENSAIVHHVGSHNSPQGAYESAF